MDGGQLCGEHGLDRDGAVGGARLGAGGGDRADGWAALGALLRLVDAPEPLGPRRWLLVGLPVGLLAGWLSAATFANLSTALEAGRAEPWPGAVWLGLIGGAAVFAAAVLVRVRGQPAYAAAVVWALVAVAVANRTEGNPTAVQTAVAGLLLAALATLVGRSRGRVRARA